MVAAQSPVERQHRFVATEIQQAIQRSLDVRGVAAAGAQDFIHHRPVRLFNLLLKIAHALSKGVDRPCPPAASLAALRAG